jgi:phage gpG-like protein
VVGVNLSGGVLNTRSGGLRESIRMQASQQDGAIGVEIFSDGDAPYAAIQEYGGKTAAHEILPDKARVLAFALNGSRVFARRIQHPGSQIPERSYLRSALEDQGDDIAQGLTTVVQRLSKDLKVSA